MGPAEELGKPWEQGSELSCSARAGTGVFMHRLLLVLASGLLLGVLTVQPFWLPLAQAG